MSQTLTLPDDLYDRLREAADRQGVMIEQLLAQWTEGPASGADGSAAAPEEGLLLACTRALLEGRQPLISADWDEIEAALQESEPHYSTIEEAMSALRDRSWTKAICTLRRRGGSRVTTAASR